MWSNLGIKESQEHKEKLENKGVKEDNCTFSGNAWGGRGLHWPQNC